MHTYIPSSSLPKYHDQYQSNEHLYMWFKGKGSKLFQRYYLLSEMEGM